jgi:uncharacterized membrane protein
LVKARKNWVTINVRLLTKINIKIITHIMTKLISINPSNYEILGEVEISTESEIKEKVKLARISQKNWDAVGSIAFYLGAGYSGSVVIPAVIASASPLVTSLMAHIKDKEKLSVYKRIGALVIVLGLMLLNLL